MAMEALDHHTSRILAYTFGCRADRAFGETQNFAGAFGYSPVLYRRLGGLLPALGLGCHVVGKRRTQQLERKHLTLRTRVKHAGRKTICFSKSVQLQEIVIGLFITRFELSLQVKFDGLN